MTRTVRPSPGRQIHVDATPRGVTVTHQAQHPWMPSLWLQSGPVDELRTLAEVQGYTRHRGLRLALLAAWTEHVGLMVGRGEGAVA